MRKLFLSGVVLVVGAFVAQYALADGGAHRGPSTAPGASIELVAHHHPGHGHPGYGGPRYGYPSPRHLPPPRVHHYRPPVVVYPPVYAYPAYRSYYYYPGCNSYYGYSRGGLQIYTGRVGVSIGF